MRSYCASTYNIESKVSIRLFDDFGDFRIAVGNGSVWVLRRCARMRWRRFLVIGGECIL